MAKKILFLCLHNMARSVTAEGLLTGEEGYEVRSRALQKKFPRAVTEEDARWADEVYVAEPYLAKRAIKAGVPEAKIKELFIPDVYEACEPDLILRLRRQLADYGIRPKKSDEQAKSDCFRVLEQKGLGWSGREFAWEWKPLELKGKQPPRFSYTEDSYFPMWHFREGKRRMQRERPADLMGELEKYTKSIKKLFER